MMDKSNEIVEKENPKGLGGWLILVGISVVISPIITINEFYVSIEPLLNEEVWDALTSDESETYHPLLGSFLIGEIIVNFCVVVLEIYVIYLFFSKHYLFPKYYITIILLTLIIPLLDKWAFSIIIEDVEIFDYETSITASRSLLYALIWVPYILISKRVKATFVEKMPNNEG